MFYSCIFLPLKSSRCIIMQSVGDASVIKWRRQRHWFSREQHAAARLRDVQRTSLGEASAPKWAGIATDVSSTHPSVEWANHPSVTIILMGLLCAARLIAAFNWLFGITLTWLFSFWNSFFFPFSISQYPFKYTICINRLGLVTNTHYTPVLKRKIGQSI